MDALTRRQFLGSSIALGTLAATAQTPVRANHVFFQHSVASGDPLANSVILWTRVTPQQQEDLTVTWEISLTKTFESVVASGTHIATRAHDHTVHIDAQHLAPDTTYFYRFHCNGQVSPTGRTKTAPVTPDSLTFAVCSCANWESGFFNAYRDIGTRADIDAVIHLGDYIYEYGVGEYSGKLGPLRHHLPEWECTTLADYRLRYATYRTDPDLQAAHAHHPWIVTWDDHEMANNAYAHGAKNHHAADSEWLDRKSAAQQAYFEWLPIWGDRLFRHFQFGTLATLTMLDLRSFRAAPGALPLPGEPDSPAILGEAQYSWLRDTLAATNTQWTILGNSVMMAPLQLVSLPAETQPIVRTLIHPEFAATINADQWDGYRSDRESLLELLAERDGRTLVVTGDLHSEWGNLIEHHGKPVAFEVIGSSISAPNADDMLFLPETNALSQATSLAVHQANPHVKHVELDAHGYALVTITPESAHLAWLRVIDKADPWSPVVIAKEMAYP